VHDFADRALGEFAKAIPYGVYDVGNDEGWVSVGDTADTAEFAVESIRRWWNQMGRARFPHASTLMITADAGGSNGPRVRAFKYHLAKLAKETGLSITVCHYPPGTSKWNKIEHRLFSFISGGVDRSAISGPSSSSSRRPPPRPASPSNVPTTRTGIPLASR
jgi:hypothetical protein